MSEFPPRLHVLLASEAPVGLVIRRGPSKSVCILLWDRRTDEFHLGQWMKGRIYERRSDLSPDGRFLIYFAMNGKWDEEARGAWTAISRAPYLNAIALFPKGDCWYGGGLFAKEDVYWLNDGSGHCGHSTLRDTTEVRRAEAYRPPDWFGAECRRVYYTRLLRDGWTLIEHREPEPLRHLDVFEKAAPGGWTLRKLAHAEVDRPPGKGCYWDEHELIHHASGRRVAGPGWEWAEVDGRRLIWAEAGRLFAAGLLEEGPIDRVQLHDFGGMIFRPIEAPY